MPIPIVTNAKVPDLNMLSQLIRHGIAYVFVPESVQQALTEIETKAQIYFAQEKPLKQKYSVTPEKREGFLDQRTKGYDIERYIIRTSLPEDPCWGEPSGQQMLDLKLYFKHEIIEPILIAIFKYLNIDPMKVQMHFEHSDSTLSVIYYPPCGKKTNQERLQAHQDTALTTVLWSNQQGLEAKVDGVWQSTLIDKNYVLLHLGHSLQLMTNNQCHGVYHRVIIPEETPRISIASFYIAPPNAPFLNAVTGEQIASSFGEYARAHVEKTYSKR